MKSDLADRIFDPNETFEIRVGGHLKEKWSKRFEGMKISCESDGTTTLSGPLPDQTALHSVLARIRDMNLKLLSVNLVELDETNDCQIKKEVNLKDTEPVEQPD